MKSAEMKIEIFMQREKCAILGDEYAKLQAEYIECYSKLASVMLREGPEHIPSADVQAALEKRKIAHEEQKTIINSLTPKMNENLSVMCALQDKLDELYTLRDKCLHEDKRFTILEGELNEIRAAYEKYKKETSTNEVELQQLLQSYAENEYYTYLKCKDFSPEKRPAPWRLQECLDAWLARRTGFLENRRKEETLLKFIEFSGAKCNALKARLELLEGEAYTSLLRLEDELGISAMLKEKKVLESTIEAANESIETAFLCLREMDEKVDYYFRKIEKDLQEKIPELPISKLHLAAQLTETEEDNALLDRIVQLISPMHSIMQDLAAEQKKLSELEAEYHEILSSELKQQQESAEWVNSLAIIADESINITISSVKSDNAISSGSSTFFGGGAPKNSSSFGGGSFKSSGSFGGGSFRTTGKF